jgi:uncharacterized membrane protein YgcG
MPRILAAYLRGSFRAGLTLGLLLLLTSTAAFSQDERSWRIARFHSTIDISEDGSAVVIERITPVFIGQWNGIFRDIPVDYPGRRGENYTLLLKVLSVKSNGEPLKYESKLQRGFRKLKIYIPGAKDTSKEVEIVYSIENPTRFFGDYDEFYWNVTGNDWPVPIDHASAFVSMPEKGAGQYRAQAFTGVYESAEQEAEVKVEGADLNFETTNPLPMRGGLTIDVYIPKGIVEEPSVLTRASWFLQGNLIVLMPLLTLLVMGAMWHYKGRDPDGGVSVATMYEPPKGLTPAEVGALADDSVDARDVTSTMVDLAVRGFIEIDEVVDEGLIFDSKDYLLRQKKDRAHWGELNAYEQTMMANMFTSGSETRLSSLKNRFYTVLPSIKSDILSALKERGMYSVDPHTAWLYRIAAVALIAAPFILLTMTGRVSFFNSPLVAGVSIVLSLIIAWLIGRHMTAKTLKGVRTWTHVAGFQEFMTRVDQDRLRRMPPDTFEKYLPFAMALGVEQRWADAFKGLITQPPSWYHGHSGRMFSPVMFSSDMRRMSNTAHAAFVAAPRANSGGSGFSSGGGFSGGGFSGGGFGGGGGGAF